MRKCFDSIFVHKEFHGKGTVNNWLDVRLYRELETCELYELLKQMKYGSWAADSFPSKLKFQKKGVSKSL